MGVAARGPDVKVEMPLAEGDRARRRHPHVLQREGGGLDRGRPALLEHRLLVGSTLTSGPRAATRRRTSCWSSAPSPPCSFSSTPTCSRPTSSTSSRSTPSGSRGGSRAVLRQSVVPAQSSSTRSTRSTRSLPPSAHARVLALIVHDVCTQRTTRNARKDRDGSAFVLHAHIVCWCCLRVFRFKVPCYL